jgi:hypothetical protein
LDFTRVVNWLGRMIRFDSSAFEEIKMDPTGMVTGIVAVAVTNLIIGIGTYLYGTLEDFPDKSDLLLRTVILGTIVQTIVWAAWPGVSYLLLNSFYRSRADIQQMFATMGFAYVPAIISALIFITFLDMPMAVVGMIAAFVLTQYAIAASSDAGSSQITYANLAGFAAFAVIMGLVVEFTGDEDYPFANGIWFLDWLAQSGRDIISAAAEAAESFDDFEP